MIVAQTKMKRMPDTCKKCSLSYIAEEGRACGEVGRYCPTEQAPSGNTRYVKPDWCPLMEIEV